MRKSRERNFSKVEKWMRPTLGKVGTRLRLDARIRFLNRKASKHPKRTFVLVVGILTLTFAVNLALTFSGIGKPVVHPEMNIASVDTVFSGFRTIQENKDIHRKALAEMTLAGNTIRHRLDSLIALPVKTRKDSLEIKMNYLKLEGIVKALKYS